MLAFGVCRLHEVYPSLSLVERMELKWQMNSEAGGLEYDHHLNEFDAPHRKKPGDRHIIPWDVSGYHPPRTMCQQGVSVIPTTMLQPLLVWKLRKAKHEGCVSTTC